MNKWSQLFMIRSIAGFFYLCFITFHFQSFSLSPQSPHCKQNCTKSVKKNRFGNFAHNEIRAIAVIPINGYHSFIAFKN